MTDTQKRQALVVQLEPGLPAYRVVGLFHAICQHPGVDSVSALSAISQETLDLMLMQPAFEPRPLRPEPTPGLFDGLDVSA